MKKAYLVWVTIGTRVVLDENATEEDKMEAAHPKILEAIADGIGDHIDDIFDDKECPYDPEKDTE